jgi:hypothetical protein
LRVIDHFEFRTSLLLECRFWKWYMLWYISILINFIGRDWAEYRDLSVESYQLFTNYSYNNYYHSIHFYPQFWLAEGPANNCVQIAVWACAVNITHAIFAAKNYVSMHTIDHSHCKNMAAHFPELSEKDIDNILSLKRRENWKKRRLKMKLV